MKLDVNITQGSYWKGAQISYWAYLLLVTLPFTGLFGVDHLLLRSPLTALLKFVSIIPLFGFWYFYDIAQAFGEEESIKKYGIGVPYYGPVGIGAGMFKDAQHPSSPPEIPRPWTYIGYVLTSILFISFPINKLVIGDYWGALAQISMFVLFPLTFMAIAWGFYDVYRIFFDARGLLEGGASRILPASWILGSTFNKSVLGPQKEIADSSWTGRLFSAASEVPIVGLKTASTALGVADMATSQLKGVVETAGDSAKHVVADTTSILDTTAQASSAAIKELGAAAEKASVLAGKLPDIAEKITSKLSDPNVLLDHAKKSSSLVQAGGLLVTGDLSVSSTVILFSVGVMAFGGYVLYTLRNTANKLSEDDDSPPKPAAL
jgi:hypothetical protein